MAAVEITEYTDPGCPFAYSAEPFRRRLRWLYGDQLEWRPRMAARAPACRAVVAARLFAPEAEWTLLRRLRVRHFSAQLLDDPGMIADAAVDAGIDTRRAGAVAQARAWSGGMRYTCPSYEIERASVPGFQPWAAYEVALANVAPGLEQREPPSDVSEVLRWAGTPLATREVAEVCQTSDREARQALGRVAVEAHVGADGFWSLTD